MQLPPMGSPLEEDEAVLAQIPKVRRRTVDDAVLYVVRFGYVVW